MVLKWILRYFETHLFLKSYTIKYHIKNKLDDLRKLLKYWFFFISIWLLFYQIVHGTLLIVRIGRYLIVIDDTIVFTIAI